MQWEEASDCAKMQTDSFEISLYRKTNNSEAGYDQSPRLTSVGDFCKPLSAPFLFRTSTMNFAEQSKLLLLPLRSSIFFEVILWLENDDLCARL